MRKKRIGILGSTGSAGRQALEVIEQFPDKFSIEVLTSPSDADILTEQAKKFSPKRVAIKEDTRLDILKKGLKGRDIQILSGEEAIEEVAFSEDVDFWFSATAGFAGLKPLLAVLEKGKDVAIAGREAMVAAGALIIEAAKTHHARLIPVNPEHSALFQCLSGEDKKDIEKIILTASGGPFLGKKTNFLVNVKRDHALQHPNREMDEKAGIDSATLMSKGMGMIEARWLFDLKPEQIELLIHPQSVIQSMVQFFDGTIKTQMGLPGLKYAIQYALGYPERFATDFQRMDFKKYPKLEFEQPDIKTFRNLALAYRALNKGGNMACVMNAANEEVVQAFLKNTIGFLDMTEIIEKTMEAIPFDGTSSLDIYIQSDRDARKYAIKLIEEKR